MTTAEIESIDAIWDGADRFNRKQEAQLLANYIRSVAVRDFGREDQHGYTIAVDAPYGRGKTFFLTRFEQQMAREHPVAYINAWADDVADDPIAAIVATLEMALEPFLTNNRVITEQFSNVKAKAWQVTKAVGFGLARRAATMALTEVGTAAVEALLEGESASSVEGEQAEPNDDTVTNIVSGTVSDASSGLAVPVKAMDDRLQAYALAKQSIFELKKALARILTALPDSKTIPLIIIIDELDRCRPAYAIKLLEQINHLFDVPGIVFVLGMNGDQLAKSIVGAYGPSFDGQTYLQRFINRNFLLQTPDLTTLLGQLIDQVGIERNRFSLDHARGELVMAGKRGDNKPSLEQVLARLMRAYGLEVRHTYEVVDRLQTSLAIFPAASLMAGYFLPLLIGHVANQTPYPAVYRPKYEVALEYHEFREFNRKPTVSDYFNIALKLEELCSNSSIELGNMLQNNHLAGVALEFKQSISAYGQNADPANYPRLIQMVDQFQLPDTN